MLIKTVSEDQSIKIKIIHKLISKWFGCFIPISSQPLNTAQIEWLVSKSYKGLMPRE